MRAEAELPPGGANVPAEPASAPTLRTYRKPLPNSWWLRNRRYTLFMIREFTVVPIALWLLSLLVELPRIHDGAAAYGAHRSAAYVVFSIVCLVVAVYHSATRLGGGGRNLMGSVGDRGVPPA